MAKACEFKNCGFVTTDECETLDQNHIYCLHCGKVIHLNIKYLDRRLGRCACGRWVEEMKDGRVVSYKRDGGMIVPSSVIQLPGDEN